MPRRVLPLVLVFLFVVRPVPCSSATSDALELLVKRAPQSLRGEVIDLDDTWTGARLLAHFGESERAYGLLRKVPAATEHAYAEGFQARLLAEIGLYERADSVLALQAYSGGLETYYTLCMQRARLNTLAGRYERALRFIALVDSLDIPAFEPYVDFIALDALTQTGRFDEACAVGERRLAKGIPLSLSPQFEQYLLDAFLGAGKLDKARRFIKVLKSRRSRSRTMAPLLVREVDLMLELQDTLQAVQSAFDIARHRSTRHVALDAVERITSVVPLAVVGEDALLRFCDVLLKGADLAGADRVTSELRNRELNKSQRERRTLFLADLYYKEKRYSKSFGLIRNKFASPSLERSAMLMRARIYRKTGQTVRSADTYVDFATRYPYDAKAAESLLVAADLYMRSANRKKSLELLNRINATYPSHRYARVATQKLAVYYMSRKHYSRGVGILEKALERTGRKSEDLLFYLADAYGRMGKPEKRSQLLSELEALNPESFYLEPHIASSYTLPIMTGAGTVALGGDRGLLEFLKNVFNRRERSYDLVREALPTLKKSNRLENSAVYLQRGRLFLQMGFRDWAELELQVLESRRLPARVSFELGVLYDDFAMHWKSVRAFQRVYYALKSETRRALGAQFKILMYPVPYPALVFENCSRYDIPPHLVYAMMRRESRFDLNAVSRAGAVGLMQLMPQTGEEVASRLGFPDGVQNNLLSPEINLTFGIWYASHLLTRSGDDPLMMLSAYNAGFGNARRWFGGKREGAAVVDDIDYRETRDYIKAIVEAARVYHRFYFDVHSASGTPSQ
ncbi:MAG: transglycosylase SLT domain-containing protein [Candidatus Krumholzibacteriia bacterium]